MADTHICNNRTRLKERVRQLGLTGAADAGRMGIGDRYGH